MQHHADVQVLFIAGFGPIVRDIEASRKLYGDVLRKEPWGQIVSRFLSPEGLLVGVTFTPSMREKK